ncbi:hypothetical protein [Krasilnikovia sp. MM14-A1259]
MLKNLVVFGTVNAHRLPRVAAGRSAAAVEDVDRLVDLLAHQGGSEAVFG